MSHPLTLGHVLLREEAFVATVTLNDPDRRNALSAALLNDLLEALAWCRAQASVRVVVLTGAGERAFCAGADLQAIMQGDSKEDRRALLEPIADLFAQLGELDKPVLGRINGHALAGGFGLALACDLLVAVEEATFGTPEVHIGLWPMLVQGLLARNLPRKVGMEMLLLGERWTAAQMKELGVVNRVVARADLDATVRDLADQMAARPPLAVSRGRAMFYGQQDATLRESLPRMSEELVALSLSQDAREGARAFLEKRRPEFQGR